MNIFQHLSAAKLIDAKLILSRVGTRHTLESIRRFLQMDTKHTKHTASAVCAGSDELTFLLCDRSVDGGIWDVR